MRILHIGPLSSTHTQIAALAYRTLGYDVTFLNTRKDQNFENVPGIQIPNTVINPWDNQKNISNRGKFGSSFFNSINSLIHYLGFSDRQLKTSLRKLRLDNSYDVIVSTWGIPVLEVTKECQKTFPECANVHNILTYPDLPLDANNIRKSIWKIYLTLYNIVETSCYKKMLSRCDIRIHSSNRMKSFMSLNNLLPVVGLDVIRVEKFNKVFFPTKRLQKISETDNKPHILHLGATNFSGLDIDNLSKQFQKFAENKIHIHFHSENYIYAVNNGFEQFYHSFEKFENHRIDSNLSEFGTQFDAIVIIYNIDKPYERFNNSLPTRFLFALTIGIPIALPKGLFASCEDYILKHKIGFTYNSERNLYEILQNKGFLKEIEHNAYIHSNQISLEDNMLEFESIFINAIANKKLLKK